MLTRNFTRLLRRVAGAPLLPVTRRCRPAPSRGTAAAAPVASTSPLAAAAPVASTISTRSAELRPTRLASVSNMQWCLPYVGRQVKVEEKPWSLATNDKKLSFSGIECMLSKDEVVVTELDRVARANGFTTRWILPGSGHLCDVKETRINVYVLKEDAIHPSKYRIFGLTLG